MRQISRSERRMAKNTTRKSSILSWMSNQSATAISVLPIILFVSFQLLHMTTVVTAQQQIYNPQNPDEPLNKYYIGKPTFEVDEQQQLSMILTYPVADFSPYENFRVRLYDDESCGAQGGDTDDDDDSDITNADYVEIDVEGDQMLPQGDGEEYRIITLKLNFDSDMIQSSSVLSQNPTTGLLTTVGFCVLMSAMSADAINPAAVSLYNRETFITVDILQNGQFAQDFVINDGTGDDELDFGGTEFTLLAYFCDEDMVEIVDPEPIFAGMPLKVCVTPDAAAKAANVYMRVIETFAWTRESIFQSSINYLQDPASLTTVDCEPGMEVCSFRTFLKPQFFYRSGSVTGSGMGWLQYGTGPCPIARPARILFGSKSSASSERIASSSSSSQSRLLTNVGDNTTGNVFGERTLQAGGDEMFSPTGSNCDGEFSLQWAGEGPLLVEHPVARLYRTNAYLCDKSNMPLQPEKNPLSSGGTARVCVEPDQLARQNNVRIRSIDRFVWERPEVDFNQTAITSSEAQNTETEIFCDRGSTICSFETKLDGQFFGEQGIVGGKGVIWFEFASEETNQRRELQVGPEFELLPNMEEGFAGASPFDVAVIVVPPLEDRELFQCIAYECDESLQRIEPQMQEKTEGASVRICVEPFDYARDKGVSMWMIESWFWWRKNFTQDAVLSQGIEAPDGRTLLTCYRGDPMCTFVTRLRGEFFNDTGAMFGEGHCWLTFGGIEFSAPIVMQEGVQEEDESDVEPTEDGLYAGDNPIKYDFPVTGNYKVPEIECPPEDHQLSQWWEEMDDTQRILIILSIVSVASSLCCTCFCCLVSGYRSRRREIVEKKEGGNIIVNVGINESSKTENVQKSTTSTDTEKTLAENESLEMSQTLLNGTPESHDVCFGDKRHPGTRDCYDCVKRYVKSRPDESYSPSAYHEICNELLRRKKRAFCVHDPDNARKRDVGDWRICTKHELISNLGEVWREVKRKHGGRG